MSAFKKSAFKKSAPKKSAPTKSAPTKSAPESLTGAQRALLELAEVGGERAVKAVLETADAMCSDWQRARSDEQREAERWAARRDAALARHADQLDEYPAAEGYLHRMYAPDPSVRRREVDGLERWDSDALCNDLIRDNEPLPSTTAVPLAIILDLADDPAGEVRAAVVRYLRGLGSRPLDASREAVLSTLERLGEDASEAVRHLVLEALGSVGAQVGTSGGDRLVALLDSENEQLAAKAFDALARLADRTPEAAIDPLRDLLRTGSASARRSAAELLGLIGRRLAPSSTGRGIYFGPEGRPINTGACARAIPELVRSLEDDAVQLAAATTLGVIGRDEGAVHALLRLLGSDAPPKVRAAAARALAHIGRRPDDVVPALVAALSDDDEEIVDAALEAAKTFKPAARAALPALRRLQKTAKGKRAELVRTILERLGEDGSAPDAKDWFLKPFDELDSR